MRTPVSFPPTPKSRMYYNERGSRFTENIVFLARDQLRVERGMENNNQQTREMSRALLEGSRLAVFDAVDAGHGIALSCGQHIATKIGAAAYHSVKSMVPVMRNSYVYFEISASPASLPVELDPRLSAPCVEGATLAVGLSTTASPLDALVGSGPGSVGLLSAGQVLQDGRWLPPRNAAMDSSYGSDSTVGCLVYVDDTSSRTVVGGAVVVEAAVTFNVDGTVVPSLLAGTQQSPAPTLWLSIDRAHELFPTVTLHSPATCVMCRFSADDVLARSRAGVGAPSSATVYAVDGSVIFEADSESQFCNGSMLYEQNVVM